MLDKLAYPSYKRIVTMAVIAIFAAVLGVFVQAEDAMANGPSLSVTSVGGINSQSDAIVVVDTDVADGNFYDDWTFNVPITLTSGMTPVAGVGFTLNISETRLEISGTTIANGINMSIQSGFERSITQTTDTNGEIEVSLFDDQNALTFTDGSIITFTYRITDTNVPTDGSLLAIPFLISPTNPLPSFSDITGTKLSNANVISGDIYFRFNAHPTDITFTYEITSVNDDLIGVVIENLTGITKVATLTTADPDIDFSRISDAYTYAFVDSGTYSNTTVVTLSTTSETTTNVVMSTTSGLQNIDYETGQITYTIKLSVTDRYGEDVAITRTIIISDMNDAPVANDDIYTGTGGSISSGSITTGFVAIEGIPIVISATSVITGISSSGLISDTDEDGTRNGGSQRDSLRITAVTAGINGGSASVDGNGDISFTAAQHNGTDTITYTISDNNATNTYNGELTATAQITLFTVINDNRGNCNSDDSIDIADAVRGIREHFDSNPDSPAWFRVYEGATTGSSPIGCDSNSDLNIGIADAICTIRIYFGADASSCTGSEKVDAASARTVPAQISIDAIASTVSPGSIINVPIQFTGNGNEVVGTGFAVDFDASKFGFDDTDADGDGIADALALNIATLGQGTQAYINYNEEESRVEIATFSLSQPFKQVYDGVIATLQLQVLDDAPLGTSSLELTNGSASTSIGNSADVELVSSIVNILDSTYLPLIAR